MMAEMRGVQFGSSGSYSRVIRPRRKSPCSQMRVGLIAVRHDEVAAHRADGVIDDEARVGELGGVKGLGADAVVGLDKDAVAAVLAAAHDEIIERGPCRPECRGQGRTYFSENARKSTISVLLFCDGTADKLRRARQELPFGLLHHAALQGLGRVARFDLDVLLQA